MENGLFRKSALDKLNAPECLDKYIQVTPPGIWIALGALLILVLSLLLWAAQGELPTVVKSTGILQNDKVVCFFPPEEAKAIRVGMTAIVNKTPARVQQVDSLPLSPEEALKGVQGDYIRASLGVGEWNVRVVLGPEESLESVALYDVSITTAKIRPLDFIVN